MEVKCSKCESMIQKPPANRQGCCDSCWIQCLEATIEYVAGNIVDNAGDTIANRRANNHQTQFEWRYAVAAQFALNLMDMVGKPHELQIDEQEIT